jgi:ketosteroid isomerase-like protein
VSEENVELVKGLYATWLALPDLRDTSRLDDAQTLLERIFGDYVNEQLEIRLPPDYPEGEPVFRGREGFVEMLAMLRDAWGEFQLQPERLLDAGDRVVAFVRVHAEGGASGVPIELETTHVWTVRTGRVTSVHAYRDRSQALEAAGLSE